MWGREHGALLYAVCSTPYYLVSRYLYEGHFNLSVLFPNTLNCVTSKWFPNSMQQIFPEFWPRDMNIYLIFSAFTSGPISLEVINKAH
jgi:hypothetical protein